MGATWSIRSNAALCATIRQAAETETAEAEAVMVAARRHEMRFFTPKSEAQQSTAILCYLRQRLERQQTRTVNAVRAAL